MGSLSGPFRDAPDGAGSLLIRVGAHRARQDSRSCIGSISVGAHRAKQDSRSCILKLLAVLGELDSYWSSAMNRLVATFRAAEFAALLDHDRWQSDFSSAVS